MSTSALHASHAHDVFKICVPGHRNVPGIALHTHTQCAMHLVALLLRCCLPPAAVVAPAAQHCPGAAAPPACFSHRIACDARSVLTAHPLPASPPALRSSLHPKCFFASCFHNHSCLAGCAAACTHAISGALWMGGGGGWPRGLNKSTRVARAAHLQDVSVVELGAGVGTMAGLLVSLLRWWHAAAGFGRRRRAHVVVCLRIA
jgi:hypothetical protein